MKMRFILPAFLFGVFPYLFLSNSAHANTNVNLFQITTDGAQQNSPLIYKDTVVYTNFGGTQGIDIWGYNLNTKQNYPIVVKPSDQFLTGLYKNLITYDDFDATTSSYHVHLYNMDINQDTAITSNPGTQNDGVTNGKDVVYINGGACGQLEDYNVLNQTLTDIPQRACTPLRMAKNIVVWADGSSIYSYNTDNNKLKTIESLPNTLSQVPNIDADGNTAVWIRSTSTNNAIVMEDLHTGKQQIITTSNDNINYPAVSEKYVVWSDSPSPNIGSVKGYNIKSGEVFTIYAVGSQQNSNIIPTLWNNTAVWSSYRTGNGDIYGAILSQ